MRPNLEDAQALGLPTNDQQNRWRPGYARYPDDSPNLEYQSRYVPTIPSGPDHVERRNAPGPVQMDAPVHADYYRSFSGRPIQRGVLCNNRFALEIVVSFHNSGHARTGGPSAQPHISFGVPPEGHSCWANPPNIHPPALEILSTQTLPY